MNRIAIYLKSPFFWALAALTSLRFMLTADFSLQVFLAPHDDLLYAGRAFELLHGNSFGPYDSIKFVKLPGQSLLLAGLSFLRIPYLFALDLFLVGSGLYLIAALGKLGFRWWSLLVVYFVYLFHPAVLQSVWTHVARESVTVSLWGALLASSLFIFNSVSTGTRVARCHRFVFAGLFAFNLLLREEAVLSFALLALLTSLLYIVQPQLVSKRRTAASFLGCTLTLVLVSQLAIRTYTHMKYDSWIIHEMNEGEFPKLIGAIRAVKSSRDSRLVNISREKLSTIAVVIPEMKLVTEHASHIPEQSASCSMFGICDEWTNSHMYFWVKDGVFAAQKPTSIAQAQEGFKRLRLKIEQACNNSTLDCHKHAGRLFGPWAWKWWPDYKTELVRIFKYGLNPEMAGHPPPSPELDALNFHYIRIFRAATLSRETMAFPVSIPPIQIAPWLKQTRTTLFSIYSKWGHLFSMAALLSFLMFVLLQPKSVLTLVGASFLSFFFLRNFALAYVSVWMGRLDPRLWFHVNFTLAVLGTMSLMALAERALGRLYGGDFNKMNLVAETNNHAPLGV